MRGIPAKALLLPLMLLLVAGGAPRRRALAVAAANDNRTPAGTLRDGVLTIALDATLAMWHPDGDSLPGLPVEVFAEAGKGPSAPGPLVRVPAGTEIRASVRNSLERDTLTFFVPARIADATKGGALDSVVLLPGEVRELRVRAERPGTYLYHANARTSLDRVLRMRGLLAGAIVVDSAGSPAPPRDRVFVLLDAVDSLTAAGVPEARREIIAINGRSWPHTERLDARVGDTLVWRVINASPNVHPMHLHGFYFRVDAFDGPPAALAGRQAAGRLAVTERMTPFTTMTLSWVPEREGNWLFHCHYQPHAMPHRPLGPTRPRERPHAAHESHALRDMGGMVMGIHVRADRGAPAVREAIARRQLRLVAVSDSGFPASLPSMRFVLEEPASGRRTDARPGFSPSIDLFRGEPVSITVVNRLNEPLAVHWHGIELESYFDGVAGFAGSGQRVAPLIAARDSFEARFTPPRSGTFIYHSHVDEPRHHRAGLAGALIVRDSTPADPAAEHLFFIKSARGSRESFPMEINGAVDPDTIVLAVGRRYRFRFIGLSVTSPNATVYLTARPDSSLLNLRDTMLVQWRPLAKDGADLPERDRTLRPAQQVVSIGETYDIEFHPRARGELRLEVRPPSAGRLFVRVPVRVEHQPVIDVHKHASWPGADDSVARAALLAEMDAEGIVLSLLHINEPSDVRDWLQAAPGRFIGGPAMPCPPTPRPPFFRCFDATRGWPDLAWLEREMAAGSIGMLGELLFVYTGDQPDDARMAPYWALAAKYDVPVAVHINRGPPPGVGPRSDPACCPGFNGEMGNPALLRPILRRHPALRILLQHVGPPGPLTFDAETRALLTDHQMVFFDMSIVNSSLSAEAHDAELKRLLDAGFGDRLVFGSDTRPAAPILRRLERIEWLTPAQRSAILYDNAARFLRLDPQTIARHHAR